MKKVRYKITFKSALNYICTICAWAVFVILIAIAMFLLYYFICSNRYQVMGEGYEPPFSIYTIVSPSMTPTIKVYDVIINTKVKRAEDIKVGDVITFKSTSPISLDKIVTHRVNEIQIINGERQFITKGDNNLSTDSDPATFENIIGKTQFKLPQLGRVQYFVSSKAGWFVVVIIPALWIIIGDVIKIIKMSKIKKNANIVNEQNSLNINNSKQVE